MGYKVSKLGSNYGTKIEDSDYQTQAAVSDGKCRLYFAGGISFDRILSSPPRRAMESAEIVASLVGYRRDDVVVEPLLNERSFGAAEDVTYQERFDQRDEEWGMESVEEFCGRALPGISRHIQADKGKGILVVAQAAVLKAAVAALTAGKIGFNDNCVQIRQGFVILLVFTNRETKEVYQNFRNHADKIFIKL